MNPRKPNWDLKRDVQKKLSQLSRQTDAAILQLIRAKLAGTCEDDVTAIAASKLAEEAELPTLGDENDSE